MSWYKNSWKDDWNYGNIFKAIIAIIIIIAIISTYNVISEGKLELLNGINAFNEEGRNGIKDFSSAWWSEASSLGKGILVVAIMVASIFIYGYFGMIDKVASATWGGIAILTAIIVGAYKVTFWWAFFIAWTLNIIILLFAQEKKNSNTEGGYEELEDKPLDGQQSWVLFGLISVFIAPLFSINAGTEGLPLMFWILFGVWGSGGFWPFGSLKKREFFKSALKATSTAIAAIFKKSWKWLGDFENLCERIQKMSSDDAKKAFEAKRVLEKIAVLIKEGKNDEANSLMLEKLSEVESLKIEEIKIEHTNGVAAELRKTLKDKQERGEKSLKMLKENFSETKLGKVKQHLHELGKLFYQENQEISIKKFGEMKKSGFEETRKVLSSFENPQFMSYSYELAQKSKRKKFWIPEFLKLLAKWNSEIDKSVRIYDKIIDKSKNNLEFSAKKSAEVAHEADDKILAVLESSKEISEKDKYTTKAISKILSGISRMREAAKQKNPQMIIETINGMESYISWLTEYIPTRGSSMKKIIKKIEEAKKEIGKSGEESMKSVLDLAKIESIAEKIGAKQ